VTQVGSNWVELQCDDPATVIHNGDGLCYLDLHRELVGLQINRAEPQGEPGRFRVFPKDAIEGLRHLKRGTVINRNRDMDWVRTLEKKSAERRIGVWMKLSRTADGLRLDLTDEDGHTAHAGLACTPEPARDAAQAPAKLREALGRLGETLFTPIDIALAFDEPLFVPASLLNPLRRDAVAALEAARAKAFTRLPRGVPVEPPAPYPEDTLTYLANVYNHKARDFYAKHGVKVIASAYESHEEAGEVSLMITKHCVRFSLSLCPKQAKGVTGVQGTVRAEPLTITHNNEKLTLRFDCKPCEMHVVGRIKPAVMQAVPASPITIYRQRPAALQT
jgi:putative protease